MNNKLSQELCHAYNDQEEHLQHHGIKNMHWGVKNGPPYPLDKKVSARIKKGKNEKARFTKKELEYMRKHPNSKKYKDKKVGISHRINRSDRLYPQVNDFTGFSELSGTSFQGKQTVMNPASLIASGAGDWIKRLDRPGKKATLGDAMDVNMDRKIWRRDESLNNNCGECSASMFLRSLGYDVQAGRNSRGSLNSAAQYWFDGATAYKQKGAANVYQQMLSFGNQGKGELIIRHKTGGGHAVYFQNERGADGRVRPVIYDGQIGKRYDNVASFLKAEHADMTQFSTVTRLDTSTPNWEHLAEDSVCRMNFTNHERNLVQVDDPRNKGYRLRYMNDNFRFI